MPPRKPPKPPTHDGPPPAKAAPWRGRKRAADGHKDKRLEVRLTAQDHAQIDAAARAEGLTIGAYVRKIAVGAPGARSKKRPTARTEALTRLLGEAGKLGSNLNQLAHWANAHAATPAAGELSAMRQELMAIRAALMEALGHDHQG